MTCMKNHRSHQNKCYNLGQREGRGIEGSLDFRIIFVFNLTCAQLPLFSVFCFYAGYQESPTTKSVVLKVAIMQWGTCGWQSGSVSHQTCESIRDQWVNRLQGGGGDMHVFHQMPSTWQTVDQDHSCAQVTWFLSLVPSIVASMQDWGQMFNAL